ncbi:MAG: hypothetical protein KAQ83_02955 [Nanoarchaeota archaeon]|nr:hypothetical protein [Nanoarchaeota archaeon]
MDELIDIVDEKVMELTKKESTRIILFVEEGLNRLKSHDLVVHCLNQLKGYLPIIGKENFVYPNSNIGEMNFTYNSKYRSLRETYSRMKDWNQNLPISDISLD